MGDGDGCGDGGRVLEAEKSEVRRRGLVRSPAMDDGTFFFVLRHDGAPDRPLVVGGHGVGIFDENGFAAFFDFEEFVVAGRGVESW